MNALMISPNSEAILELDLRLELLEGDIKQVDESKDYEELIRVLDLVRDEFLTTLAKSVTLNRTKGAEIKKALVDYKHIRYKELYYRLSIMECSYIVGSYFWDPIM